MFDMQKLKSLASPAPAKGQDLMSQARKCYEYFLEVSAQDAILYSSFQSFYIYAKLGKQKYIERTFPNDFNLDMFPDSRWAINFDGSSYSIFDPSDKNEEQIVILRKFECVEDEDRVELSQKLIHCLELFWIDGRSAFCTLSENGDVEAVITIHESIGGADRETIVTMKREYLDRYMALTGTVLVSKIFFEHSAPDFGHWNSRPKMQSNSSLSISVYSQSDASSIDGLIVFPPAITKTQLNSEKRKRKYEKFKVWDRKNGKKCIVSCAPGFTVNYFTESELPWEVTPAFFKPEVLSKYKADPEKYELNHRSIICRNQWTLRTYDVNEAGQVHTYLIYLRDLPHAEQLYWASFNEWPKADISERAYQTDIVGEFTTIQDPIINLKRKISELDSQKFKWWQPRPSDLANKVHYPFSSSQAEWANSILNLTQFMVEGFFPTGIREQLTTLQVPFDKESKSLTLLAQLIEAKSDKATAIAMLAPLRELQELRSKVIGHAGGRDKKTRVDKAISDHGSFYKHFKDLATACNSSFQQIVDILK